MQPTPTTEPTISQHCESAWRCYRLATTINDDDAAGELMKLGREHAEAAIAGGVSPEALPNFHRATFEPRLLAAYFSR